MSKKTKMGRPPLPRGEVREVFALRLSPAERDAIERAAKAAGINASEWARLTLVAATKSP